MYVCMYVYNIFQYIYIYTYGIYLYTHLELFSIHIYDSTIPRSSHTSPLVGQQGSQRFRSFHLLDEDPGNAADDLNPALPIMRNIP